MADRRFGDAGLVHAVPGYLDHQCGAAPYAAQLRRQGRPDYLGRDQLSDRNRGGPADDRMDRDPDWSPGLFHRINHRLHAGFGVLRSGANPDANRGCALHPGCGRRRDDAVGPGDSARNISALRAHAGDVHAVAGLGDGAGVRSHARRLDHDEPELALELLHQCAGQRDRRRNGLHLRARSAAPAQAHR